MDDQSLTTASPPELPGALLKQARTRAGLNVREVAEKLHLLPRQVTALEAGDYQHFNGDIFCKGYLKAYAKILHVDHQMIVERYVQLAAGQSTAAGKPSSKGSSMHSSGRGRSIQYWSLAALIAVIIILWLLNIGANHQTAELPASVQPAVVVVDENDRSLLQALEPRSEKTATENDFVIPGLAAGQARQVGDQVLDSAAATGTLPTAVIGEVLEPMAGDLTASEMAAEQPATTVELLAAAPTVATQKNEDMLNFRFSRDCWVKVTNGNGEVIHSRLNRAEETLKLSGVAPFKVVLGYAPGVSLDFNGENVAIDINGKNNSALLVVGQ